MPFCSLVSNFDCFKFILELKLSSEPVEIEKTKTKTKMNLKEAIYSEFLNLLSQDREVKLSNLRLELEKIKELKKQFGISDEISVIGSKRRATRFDYKAYCYSYYCSYSYLVIWMRERFQRYIPISNHFPRHFPRMSTGKSLKSD